MLLSYTYLDAYNCAVMLFCPSSYCHAAWSANCNHNVFCLSVSLSVTKCIVTLRVGVGVEGCTVVFLGRHLLFTSSYTFAVHGMYRSARKHSEKNVPPKFLPGLEYGC